MQRCYKKIILILITCLISACSVIPKKSPLIIAHRGASGHRPEHTMEAYQLAIEMGSDFIEPDLVVTKDGHLIARHENEISETTDVAEKFPKRKTTKLVDGKKMTGWFTEDFTLKEIKTLRAVERLKFRNQELNGKFQIPTFEEVLDLAKKESLKKSISIGVYPETKHPTHFKNLNLAFEERLIKVLKKADLNSSLNPIFIQSFEPTILKNLKSRTDYPLVLLIGDLSEVPFDLQTTNSKMNYKDLLSDNGLLDLKNYVSGIGFHKSHVLESQLLNRVQKHKFLVHVYTFRSDTQYLNMKYLGRPELEYFEYFNLGIDGVFSDFPDDALKARKIYLETN